MIAVLIGPSGAGKSSQSQLLAKREHIEWVYVGQLLRDQHDPKIDAALNQGRLADDEAVNTILAAHLKTLAPDKVVVLDGFPRHLPQAQWLIQFADELHNGLRLVIHLTVPEVVARQRLSARQRSDDTASSIDERLKNYKSLVLPVLDYFAEAGIPIQTVDGDRPVEQVFNDIDEALHRVYEDQNA